MPNEAPLPNPPKDEIEDEDPTVLNLPLDTYENDDNVDLPDGHPEAK